jgi:hypothetical protein
LPLAAIVVILTEAVRASGTLSAAQLPGAFERVSGTSVPAQRAEILRGIAWQGTALKYLQHEKVDGDDVWRPGLVLPAQDRRWGAWSIDSFKAHVASQNGNADEAALCADLFTGQARTTVKRLVRAAIREVG